MRREWRGWYVRGAEWSMDSAIRQVEGNGQRLVGKVWWVLG